MKNLEADKLLRRNTRALYLRTLLAIAVGLFTSRIVLQTLGVTDYGIYGVVAGFIGLMAILNTSMADSTTRFISFELGRKTIAQGDVPKVLGASRALHFLIAMAVLLLAETVGLWYVRTGLNVPSESLQDTVIVYQIAVLSTLVSITQVPYTALIMSHERLTLYARVEIVNVALRLVAVLLLVVLPADKLILYAAMTAGISIGISLFYRIYCYRQFPESIGKVSWKKSSLLPMIKFSGQDLYGKGCETARHEGIILLLNRFFGVAVNAATSLSGTVNMAISNLTGSVLTAYHPRIVKAFSGRDFQSFNSLINRGLRVCGMLYLMMCLPLLVCTDEVLVLWLGEVPTFTAVFTQLGLIASFFTLLTGMLYAGMRAAGKIKVQSFFAGTVYLLVLPIIYISLFNGAEPDTAYLWLIGSNGLILAATLIIFKRAVPALKLEAVLRSLTVTIVYGVFTFMVIRATLSIVDTIDLASPETILHAVINLGVACFVSLICTAIYSKIKLTRNP